MVCHLSNVCFLPIIGRELCIHSGASKEQEEDRAHQRETNKDRAYTSSQKEHNYCRLLSRGRVQTHARGAQHKLCEGSGLPCAWAEAGRKQHRKDRRARVRRLLFYQHAHPTDIPKGSSGLAYEPLLRQ